ncbi:MAG: hypothetical protein AB7T22_12675 [Calditrichaceae bacterium]
MQKQSAINLIEETRYLVGKEIELKRLDLNSDKYSTETFRILDNSSIISLTNPSSARVRLDVYAKVENQMTKEILHISLKRLAELYLS